MEHLAEQSLHLFVGGRGGRDGIEGAFAARVIEREFIQAHQVVDVNPGYPLFAGAE